MTRRGENTGELVSFEVDHSAAKSENVEQQLQLHVLLL